MKKDWKTTLLGYGAALYALAGDWFATGQPLTWKNLAGFLLFAAWGHVQADKKND